MNEDTKAIVEAIRYVGEAIRYVGDMVVMVGVIITLQILWIWTFSIKEAKRNRKVKRDDYHNDDRSNRQA